MRKVGKILSNVISLDFSNKLIIIYPKQPKNITIFINYEFINSKCKITASNDDKNMII